jgi:hypothetical protein
MCLVVSNKNNMFIAKKDIIVYKQLEESYDGFVTPRQNFPVKLNSEIIPKGKIELRSFGSKQCLDRGAIHAYTIISDSEIYFEAIIKKGTKFWIQDDLTQIAAEKLYLTDKRVSTEDYKPTDFSDYLEEGVDVYLKDGRRCKLTDSFDKKDVLGIYGYDNQVIALEYKCLTLSEEELPNEISKNNFIETNNSDVINKLEKDLDGYGNTKQLKSLGIKSEALDYCEGLRKDWYIPASGELKKLFKNQLRINITLQYLGKPILDFTWFWSSTLEPTKYAWRCYSDGYGNWYGDGFDYGYVHDRYYVLPFLELS